MRKIGRNEPCPCGSGKKYKKCCIDHPELIQHSVEGKWTYNEVNRMTTDEIVQRLKSSGIPFEQNRFPQEVEKYYSAEQISNHWHDTCERAIPSRESDFLWLAAWVLWERMASPSNLSMEQICRLIDQGGQHWEHDDYKTASDIWLTAWEAIKYKHNPEYKDLSFLEEQYRGGFFVRNLCQDLDDSLCNAGLTDHTYHKKRMNFSLEFLSLFPDEEEPPPHNMRRAVAESYASLGDYRQADREFQKIAEDYPHNPWSYIGWGDLYYWDKKDDYDKAKELYLKALAVSEDEDDIMVVQERLDDLERDLKQ